MDNTPNNHQYLVREACLGLLRCEIHSIPATEIKEEYQDMIVLNGTDKVAALKKMSVDNWWWVSDEGKTKDEF